MDITAKLDNFLNKNESKQERLQEAALKTVSYGAAGTLVYWPAGKGYFGVNLDDDDQISAALIIGDPNDEESYMDNATAAEIKKNADNIGAAIALLIKKHNLYGYHKIYLGNMSI